MIAQISTYFNCTQEKFWKKISQPKSLQFVASPILTFKPIDEGVLDNEWIVGKPYHLKLYFLNILPLGHHEIKLITINKETNTIVSNESGKLVPLWNHTINFSQVKPNKLHYTDKIEIKASWLTPAIWLFAHIFYRHRQRRWKILLEN